MTPAASELPSYDLVIPALLNVGIDKLREECKLTPGVPLKPMLAKPTKAIGEVLDKFEGKKFTCEYKYDGERAQVRSAQRVQQHQVPQPLIDAWFTLGPQACGWHHRGLQSQLRGHEQKVSGPDGAAAPGAFTFSTARREPVPDH